MHYAITSRAILVGFLCIPTLMDPHNMIKFLGYETSIDVYMIRFVCLLYMSVTMSSLSLVKPLRGIPFWKKNIDYSIDSHANKYKVLDKGFWNDYSGVCLGVACADISPLLSFVWYIFTEHSRPFELDGFSELSLLICTLSSFVWVLICIKTCHTVKQKNTVITAII